MRRKFLYLISSVLVLVFVNYSLADLIAQYEFEYVGDFSNSIDEGVGEPFGQAQVVWDQEIESYVLSLDGDGDYVYYESQWQGLVDTAITVTAWIKTDSLASYDSIVGLGYAWRLYGGSTGNLRFQCSDTLPQASMAVGSVDVNDNQWHHIAGTYDGTKYNLFVDGVLDVSMEASGRINQGGSYYSCIGAHYKKNDERDPRRFFDGFIDDVRIYNKAISPNEIWQIFTYKPGRASKPNPTDGQINVDRNVILNWSPGDNASQHHVYFGTDFNDVNDAYIHEANGIYRGIQDDNYYTPTETLEWGGIYYWRIDEVNNAHPDSPWKGSVWNFTAADFFLVDDFESYNDLDPTDPNSNRIFLAWIDGLEDPTNGSVVGYAEPPFAEQNIVHSGTQAMPFLYDNNTKESLKYSEAELMLSSQRDWTHEGVEVLTIWFRGYPESVGNFTEEPAGTYTLTAAGKDIWNKADEFHYAFKTLRGSGEIIVKVESVQNTNKWAKAGVMIRESLDAGSKFAAIYITPTNADGTAESGCSLQARLKTDDSASSDSSIATDEQKAIIAPFWIKLKRELSGKFIGYFSSNALTWKPIIWQPSIQMNKDVYIGLALTSHDTTLTCEAKFSNVQINGTVSGQWQSQDIGIISNEPEPMYVALNNNAVVYHDNPNAALTETWMQWNIDLKEFEQQGVNLTNVDKIAIGFGNRNNPQPGGSGKMYFDDIRLYRPESQIP